MHEFRIYIVGGSNSSAKAMKAVENLEKLLKGEFRDKYILKIIDVLKNPQLIQEDSIFATPTIRRIYPLPNRTVIGDLSDGEKVLAILLS